MDLLQMKGVNYINQQTATIQEKQIIFSLKSTAVVKWRRYGNYLSSIGFREKTVNLLVIC